MGTKSLKVDCFPKCKRIFTSTAKKNLVREYVIIICITRHKSQNLTLDVFVCVEILRPSQPNGVMSSAVSLHFY